MDPRRSDRILLAIPILVAGCAATGGEFSEQTHTLVVNRDGARLALKHPAAEQDIIHIINLDNMRGADFRLVGRMNGPAAAVWSRDIAKAHRTAERLRAGTVWVNCYNVFDPAIPFGGYKQSGWGREMGHEMLELYTETKTVVVAL